MFGYITPLKPELKIKEFETYKAYYCGLCQGIRHHFGHLPRIFLSYDVLFLCLFCDGLKEKQKETYVRARCVVHPLKKRIHALSPDLFQFGAEVNVILSYYKCIDDLKDHPSFKNRFKFIYAKLSAGKKHPAPLGQKISASFLRQTELEGQRAPLDAFSEPFSEMLYACLLHYNTWPSETEKILKVFAYNLGKWIYLLDAWDDLEENIRQKEFNPFLLGQENPQAHLIKSKEKERITFLLSYAHSQMIHAYELLSFHKHKSLLDNIIYQGLAQKQMQILNKSEDKNSERPL